MSHLFEPLTLRGVTLPNRLVVAPMCTYSANNGVANDFHLIHLGRFALGGFGTVIVEATAVAPEGRISPGDLGLWCDDQQPGLQRIAAALRAHGAVPAIQLAHAGRKASAQRPWDGDGPLSASSCEAAWQTVSASADPYAEGWSAPEMLDGAGMARILDSFVAATRRAAAAGFEVVELHCAHGYLLNSFLSPLSNRRTDIYGGDLAGRMRFPLTVARAMRAALPREKPLFVRVSAVDGVVGGTTIGETVAFARALGEIGVDVVDCSSGGITPHFEVAVDYGFQTSFAARVREGSGIPTMAVGLIVDPHQAEQIVAGGKADLVALGREALADPDFPLAAARSLGVVDVSHPFDPYPKQAGWWLNQRHGTITRLGPYQRGDDA